MGIKAISTPKDYKNRRYAINNVSMKDLSKIIRKFEKLSYKSYERRRPKHDPTDSYFYLAIQFAKCMMRTDALNSHTYPLRTETTGTKQIRILHVCSTDERESKPSLVGQTLSRVYSTDKQKFKRVIVDESYTEESESECFHKKLKQRGRHKE